MESSSSSINPSNNLPLIMFRLRKIRITHLTLQLKAKPNSLFPSPSSSSSSSSSSSFPPPPSSSSSPLILFPSLSLFPPLYAWCVYVLCIRNKDPLPLDKYQVKGPLPSFSFLFPFFRV